MPAIAVSNLEGLLSHCYEGTWWFLSWEQGTLSVLYLHFSLIKQFVTCLPPIYAPKGSQRPVWKTLVGTDFLWIDTTVASPTQIQILQLPSNEHNDVVSFRALVANLLRWTHSEKIFTYLNPLPPWYLLLLKNMASLHAYTPIHLCGHRTS